MIDFWWIFFFGLGVWCGDITWWAFRGKKEGHNFRYYSNRGLLKAVISALLLTIYMKATYG